MVKNLFSRAHILKTLLIIVLVGTFVRLGIWQLDRLEQRRAANIVLAAQLAADPILLNTVSDWNSLVEMEDRAVRVQGAFDFEQQVILKNQNISFGPGVHLIAPFVLEDGKTAVLVDRGWVRDTETELTPFNEPLSDLTGIIRPSEKVISEITASQSEFFRIAIPQLQAQMPYNLLPIYILQAPLETDTIETRPYRTSPQFDLSEGSHMGYAIQWFAFALIFTVGYLSYIQPRGG